MQAVTLYLQETVLKPSEVTPNYLQCFEENAHGQFTLLDREYETQDIVYLVHDEICQAWRVSLGKA